MVYLFMPDDLTLHAVTEQRFKAPKTNFEPIRDPHHLATVALNQELAAFMPPPVERRAMRYDTLFLL
jgi:hypothetical protein